MKRFKLRYQKIIALLQVIALKVLFGDQVATEMILSWGKYQQAILRHERELQKKTERRKKRYKKKK